MANPIVTITMENGDVIKAEFCVCSWRSPQNKNCALRKTLRAQMGKSIIFFHPDFTVGIGISPIQPFGSRTVPPVGNHTLP